MIDFQEVNLFPGQLVFGRKKVSADIPLSEQEIRTCIRKLVDLGNISIMSTNKFSIITVINWSKYQLYTTDSTGGPNVYCLPTTIPTKINQHINQQNNENNSIVTGAYSDVENKSTSTSTSQQPAANHIQQRINKEKQERLLSSEKQDDAIHPLENGKIPYKDIVSLFHTVLPELPQIIKLTDNRKVALRGRWNTEEKTRSLEWWREYFEWIRDSDFLMGKTSKPFACCFDWIIKAANFTKIREGNYHR